MPIVVHIHSRYRQVPNTMVAQYASGAVMGDDYLEAHRVPAGRYTTWKTPADVIQYVSQEGDTLRSIAQNFYGSFRLWWVIADFNPDTSFPLTDLVVGTALVLPHPSAVGMDKARA